ncbi:MAG: hypothetical protein VZS44_00675 [Bacilli bacterium]|nr:hypothetical protein [Bacilli bacterium]
MKRTDEFVGRINKQYVADDCIQIMLAYRDYLLLYGNDSLMHYKNYSCSDPLICNLFVNAYLDDERKDIFPYSQIPTHIERVSLFRKIYSVNQILDFEKPYIRINDGIITKITAFKDGSEALVHYKILNGKLCNRKSKIITREEIEKYFETGSLDQLDENEYNKNRIFDLNGIIFSNVQDFSKLERKWIDIEKERLLSLIDKSSYMEITKKELKGAISNMDDILPTNIPLKYMIKFKKNGEIVIDVFSVKYLERGKYDILLENIPVTMESLSMIKETNPVIKTIKEPKISRFLNPGISKEQLIEEKRKILSKI